MSRRRMVRPDGAVPGFVYLGRGPGCLGIGGWSRAAEVVYRCAGCGSAVAADREEAFRCECGAMVLDPDGGRFGSRLGDEAVLVFRREEELGTGGR